MGNRGFGELTRKELAAHYAGYTGYSLVESIKATIHAAHA
jgi:hypothetical protein